MHILIYTALVSQSRVSKKFVCYHEGVSMQANNENTSNLPTSSLSSKLESADSCPREVLHGHHGNTYIRMNYTYVEGLCKTEARIMGKSGHDAILRESTRGGITRFSRILRWFKK